jgi:hypothetical protein
MFEIIYFLYVDVPDSEDTNDENHKGQPSGEWDGRRRSAAAAAASRRRAKQRREATGTAPGIGGHDLNNTVSSIAHKAPQDRPDCKNHLKVTLHLLESYN